MKIRHGFSRCESNASDGLTRLLFFTSDAEDEKDDVDVDYEPPPRSADEDGCSSAESSQGESIGAESEPEGGEADSNSIDHPPPQSEDTVMASVDDCQPMTSPKVTDATANRDGIGGAEEAPHVKQEAYLDSGASAQGEASTHSGAQAPSSTSQQSDDEAGRAVRRSGRSKR